MAKQPDFAQKPPDDLPARKDRMDLPQGTRRLDLDPRPTEKHDGSRWPLRGSGETAGKKMVSIFHRSKQTPETRRCFHYFVILFPYCRGAGRSRRTNSRCRRFMEEDIRTGTHGKLQSWRKIYELGSSQEALGQRVSSAPVVNKLRRKRRRQEPSFSNPTRFSVANGRDLEGAEKIRRILRAYYREYESDRGSVDIGRDLLRGVIDLKESLSRLQRLQGATDSMAKKPQREGAALLKEKEDDERSKKHKTLKNRTLSFHGVPKYPLEGDRGLQRQTAVKPNSGEYVDDSVKIGSHRRSMSCAPSFRLETTVLASRNEPNKERVHKSSDSKSPMEAVSKNNAPIRDTQRVPSQVSYGDEKKMIPNVIARLMGLEDLPTFITESKNRGGKEVTHSGQEARTSKNLRPSMEGNEERTHMETLAEESALRKGVRTRVLPEKELVAIRIIRSSEGLNSGTTSSEPKADGNASTLTEVGLVFEDLQDPPLVYNLHATNRMQVQCHYLKEEMINKNHAMH
ncbi:unnamed protein product [Spirodela intermedia]|uniref:DUF3741 domain-containing protein n=1 Tax=Spirodela intermedia TaxID=51605 RepID=A0A7I8IKS2_SPIIN|nr:unnamed protein product [Spirodela intermedia]CAA6657597.1 unnamed protein product [Spirodela intermedia]